MKAPSTIGLACVLSLAFTGCGGGIRRTSSGAIEVGECHIGGCSSHWCGDQTGLESTSTCEWKDEYACYRAATCEPQQDGQCGWTQTPELASCLADNQPRCGFGVLCITDSDCPGGEVCESCEGVASCTRGCRHDGQCQSGQRCRATECAACPCPSQCA